MCEFCCTLDNKSDSVKAGHCTPHRNNHHLCKRNVYEVQVGNRTLGVSILTIVTWMSKDLHSWVLLHFCLGARGCLFGSIKMEASVWIVYLGKTVLLMKLCESINLGQECVGREMQRCYTFCRTWSINFLKPNSSNSSCFGEDERHMEARVPTDPKGSSFW